jgi:hypothetical protein
MGMFDYVDFEMRCPYCREIVSSFQTKCADNVLDHISPESVNEFHTNCDNCDTWISFKQIPDELVDRYKLKGTISNYWKFGDFYYRCVCTYDYNNPFGG